MYVAEDPSLRSRKEKEKMLVHERQIEFIPFG